MIVVVFVVKGTVFAQMWYINFVTLPGSPAVSSKRNPSKSHKVPFLRQRTAIYKTLIEQVKQTVNLVNLQ